MLKKLMDEVGVSSVEDLKEFVESVFKSQDFAINPTHLRFLTPDGDIKEISIKPTENK